MWLLIAAIPANSNSSSSCWPKPSCVPSPDVQSQSAPDALSSVCAAIVLVLCFGVALLLRCCPLSPPPPRLHVEIHTWSYSPLSPGDTKCCWCQWAGRLWNDWAPDCIVRDTSFFVELCFFFFVDKLFFSLNNHILLLFRPLRSFFHLTMLLPSSPGLPGMYQPAWLSCLETGTVAEPSDEKAAKLVTAVRVRISLSVIVKPLDILDEGLRSNFS